ncbi:hypothetical protein ON010_g16466 [Phytophthora cinnamomi]|nr:hypothetical protein ON010_g16466 [Phytophthora cinnamomi]
MVAEINYNRNERATHVREEARSVCCRDPSSPAYRPRCGNQQQQGGQSRDQFTANVNNDGDNAEAARGRDKLSAVLPSGEYNAITYVEEVDSDKSTNRDASADISAVTRDSEHLDTTATRGGGALLAKPRTTTDIFKRSPHVRLANCDQVTHACMPDPQRSSSPEGLQTEIPFQTRMNPEIAPLSDAIGLLRELDDIEDVAIAAWLAGTYFTVEYPLVPNVRVDLTSYPDRDALNDYRFTCTQLRLRESPESVLQWAQAASLFKLPRRLYAGRLGLCMSFFGPLEGTRHDSTMLKESGLLVYLMDNPALQSITAVMYGDPAYGVSDRLTSPVRGVDLSRNERDFNVIMSKVRVSIEWLFGIVKPYTSRYLYEES